MLTSDPSWFGSRLRPLLVLLLAAVALADLFSHSLAATPSTAAPETARSAPALAASATPNTDQPASLACWLTGDPGGEANPAMLAIAACAGPQGQPSASSTSTHRHALSVRARARAVVGSLAPARCPSSALPTTVSTTGGSTLTYAATDVGRQAGGNPQPERVRRRRHHSHAHASLLARAMST